MPSIRAEEMYNLLQYVSIVLQLNLLIALIRGLTEDPLWQFVQVRQEVILTIFRKPRGEEMTGDAFSDL
jgi:hypothetical protein